MIIVADSGSTCTDWVIIEEKQLIDTFKTKGFNPYFTKSEEITGELKSKYPKHIDLNAIETIYFYGSGCSSKEMNLIIHNGLSPFFKNSKIEIEHDLLAAARALFQNESGIAVILGTGSNTCYYDGKSIVKNITSLGFILGDEGGGDYMGKLLIQRYLNKELPDEIMHAFFSEYNLTSNQILHAVYKEEYPNRFLSTFSKFILNHAENEAISKIINTTFSDLFSKHICKYKNYKNLNIRCTGSISHFFSKQLNAVAKSYSAQIDLIEKEPIKGLTQYHINNT
jgi:N-acetylglucosamine kinase-like BadF-type ATPase